MTCGASAAAPASTGTAVMMPPSASANQTWWPKATAVPGSCWGMTAVCGATGLTTFAVDGSASPVMTRNDAALCLIDHALHQRQQPSQLGADTGCARVGAPAIVGRFGLDPLRLPHQRADNPEQPAGDGLARGSPGRIPAPGTPMPRLHATPRAAGVIAEGVPHLGAPRPHHRSGAADAPAARAHAVGEEARIGRVVDRRLDHRAIDAQLASAPHLQLPCHDHDMIEETLPRLRPDTVGPPEQARMVRHTGDADATAARRPEQSSGAGAVVWSGTRAMPMRQNWRSISESPTKCSVSA